MVCILNHAEESEMEIPHKLFMQRAPRFLGALVVLATVSSLLAQQKDNWPQFRGENAAGVAAAGAAPPVEFGPAKRLLWKQAVPSGHSSPAVWGDRIFLTAFDKDSKRL